MKLKKIAHSRTGDKGEISNISLIPFAEEDYEFLKEQITPEIVKNYFSDICKGEVKRYELPGVKAFNYFLDKTLGGGVTRSLAVDKHGKTLGMALLEMEVSDEEYESFHRSLKSNETGSVDFCNSTTGGIKKQYECCQELLSTNEAISRVFEEKKTVRIGSGAGYAGDRLDPALEMMEKGKLDYIIFECLAERTIAIGQQAKEKDRDAGYNSLLEYRMEKVIPLAAENNIKVITNMGAANPVSAAKKVEHICEELGVNNLKIAAVIGDDVFEQLSKYQDNTILENGNKLGNFNVETVSANAYMGAEGIIDALKNGADIIITGRVSDPALTIAPLVYEFGWDVDHDPDYMGQAVLAGHLLECAGQVTGGYYADPGVKDVENLEHLGFPIIEISEDGRLVVTKVAGSGGMVTIDTCKEQMIYEIHDPERYMTPDAIADFSHVKFTQIGKDAVLAEHATSHGKPETLKVSIGYKDCFTGEGEISYGGTGCMERAQLAADIITKRLDLFEEQPEEYRVDYIGFNSLYRNTISSKLSSGRHSEIRLRISGRYKTKEAAEILGNEIEALYTNGPAGGGGASKRVTEILSVCSIFIPRENTESKVIMMGGPKEIIPLPVKAIVTRIQAFGNIIKKHVPQLNDPEELAALPADLMFSDLKEYYSIPDNQFELIADDYVKAVTEFRRKSAEEINEFGVEVDVNDPCHIWSNTDISVQKKCVERIIEKYKGRKGEIVFYGPSNIQLWYSLEKDMLPYAAQNHGMGGCVDEEMIRYAKEMMYDFEPSVVFFQTGSNDLANGWTLEQILENKKNMYGMYLKNMPETKLVIMSGLPLPGRQLFWEDTVKINALLKDMCEKTDRMYFMDATDVLMSETGSEEMKAYDGRYFRPECYRIDGIHLNKFGHDIWTAEMKKIIREIL